MLTLSSDGLKLKSSTACFNDRSAAVHAIALCRVGVASGHAWGRRRSVVTDRPDLITRVERRF